MGPRSGCPRSRRRWCAATALSNCQGPSLLQPLEIRSLRGQQVAGKAEGVDAETRAMLPFAAHTEEPVVVEQQVVGMAGLGVMPRDRPAPAVLVVVLLQVEMARASSAVDPGARWLPPD
jgi:hypothetical protein